MLEPGQVFAGRYRIIRLIAPGGMGAVFEAEHTGTERHVALKLLWPHVMELKSSRDKFEFEAKVAARVQSEHIVHVLDAGFDEPTRSPYLVMELLPGGTLAQFVQERGRIGPELTVQLLLQVAKGLDAAHGLRNAEGSRTPIVHRDLKPENLMLVMRQNALPLVKILDFGISKLLSESRSTSHEIRGTPMYMAYEQVSAERISPQTDIWALGLIAYFMLTGRSYWRSANDPEATMEALFMEIVLLPLAPASVRLREQNPDIELPPAFDGWLARCIDRAPERRFESASAAIISLDAVLRGKAAQTLIEPLSALPESVAKSRTVSVPRPPQANGPLASTAASLPAIESRPALAQSVWREGVGQHWRLGAVGLSLLVLIGAVFSWRSGSENGAATQAGSALLPVPVEAEPTAPTPTPQTKPEPAAPALPARAEPEHRASAPSPGAEAELPSSPRVSLAPPSPPLAPASVNPWSTPTSAPVSRPAPPSADRKGSPAKPSNPSQRAGASGQRLAPAGPTRLENAPEKQRVEPTHVPLNPFDMR
jgi:serine/threonine-protein kinase